MEIRTSVSPTKRIRDRLTDQQVTDRERQRLDRFHCSVLVLPCDDKGGQHGPHDHDDDGNDSGNDEITALQVFVKPYAHAAVDGRPYLVHPLAVRNEISSFWLYCEMKAFTYPRVILAKLGSLPSRRT